MLLSEKEKEIENNISIINASILMGISQQTLRCGLKAGLFSFGVAIKNNDSMRHVYYINPYQFYTYLGRKDLLNEWYNSINEAYGTVRLKKIDY